MSPAADPGQTTLPSLNPRRVLVLGASGTIGRATARALLQRGHTPVAFVRPGAAALPALKDIEIRTGDVTDAAGGRARWHPGGALRRACLLPCFSQRRAQGRLGYRPSGAQ